MCKVKLRLICSIHILKTKLAYSERKLDSAAGKDRAKEKGEKPNKQVKSHYLNRRKSITISGDA